MRKLLILALIVTGCMTPRGAQRKLSKVYHAQPIEHARDCGERYPVRESVFDSTWFSHGNPDTQWVTVDCDSVMVATLQPNLETMKPGTKIVRVPCPPCKPDTLYRSVTRIQENTALLRSCQLQATKDKAEAERLKEGRNTWRGIALSALAIIVIAVVVWIIRKPLP